jgi:RecA/RadA recombinase
MKKQELPELEEAIKKLRKQYGDDVILQADDEGAEVASIPTGCYAVDRVIGSGGLPRGSG